MQEKAIDDLLQLNGEQCLKRGELIPELVVRPVRGYSKAFKRLVDVFIGCLSIVIFGPLILLVAGLVKLTSSGPVIYKQVRVGYAGKEFRCYKFRTMINGAEDLLDLYLENNPAARSEWDIRFKLENDPRVTGLGKFLRAWSLDELPQLFNVIKGDISLVGPRPLLPPEIEVYGEGFVDYCRVMPGITGLWQVSGRNCLSFSQRAELDSWYIKHWSPGLDFKILLRTFLAVLSGRGAY